VKSAGGSGHGMERQIGCRLFFSYSQEKRIHVYRELKDVWVGWGEWLVI
jgi:hypothetical protein